ncbi:hypothetical protein Tco_0871032 [Tanacetum coccineum]
MSSMPSILSYLAALVFVVEVVYFLLKLPPFKYSSSHEAFASCSLRIESRSYQNLLGHDYQSKRCLGRYSGEVDRSAHKTHQNVEKLSCFGNVAIHQLDIEVDLMFPSHLFDLVAITVSHSSNTVSSLATDFPEDFGVRLGALDELGGRIF